MTAAGPSPEQVTAAQTGAHMRAPATRARPRPLRRRHAPQCCRCAPPPLPLAGYAGGQILVLGVLVAGQAPEEARRPLRPEAGSRFSDWALWVDETCPLDISGPVLAALRIYAAERTDAAGDTLVGSEG